MYRVALLALVLGLLLAWVLTQNRLDGLATAALLIGSGTAGLVLRHGTASPSARPTRSSDPDPFLPR